MDIQQLTLVINLLKDVADGALIGFILYLVVAYLLPYVFGVVVVYYVFRFFCKWVAAAYNLDWFQQQAASLGQLWAYDYDWKDVPKTRRLISEKLAGKK